MAYAETDVKMESEKNINIRDNGEVAEKEELLHRNNRRRGGIRTLPFILGISSFLHFPPQTFFFSDQSVTIQIINFTHYIPIFNTGNSELNLHL